MKERTVPLGFDSLEEHDKLMGIHLELVQTHACAQVRSGTGSISQCCGAGPAENGNSAYNIQVKHGAPRPQGYNGTTHEFTIKDKKNGPFQILWRDEE